MDSIAAKRCFVHSEREAAARCPECGNFFCRECVTEYDDRVICTFCLKKKVGGSAAGGKGFTVLRRSAPVLSGFLLLWLFFYMVGRLLMALPEKFHDGSFWDAAAWWK